MSAVASVRVASPRRRRALFLVGLASAAAASGALAAIFAWPRPHVERTRFDLGPADDYRTGSVTKIIEGKFYLVRLSKDDFVAVSWHDPFSGCAVPWRPEYVLRGHRGWFRDPCHTSTYDREGRWVAGDHLPHDLYRFSVSLKNGRVIVDTSRYVCGFAPPGARCAGPTPAR